jgi:hypothetical protein
MEYGDYSTAMGATNNLFNSVNMNTLGLLDEIEIQKNTTDGIYSITSLHDENESFIPKVYVVRTAGGDFYISLRKSENEIETELASTFDNKLNIHHALPEGQSIFIKSVGASQEFTDSAESIKISNVRNDGSTFQFKVEVLKSADRSGKGDCDINAF